MSKRRAMMMKPVCWVAISLFLCAAIGFAAMAVKEMITPSGGLWCANTITDPLHALLNYGFPICAFCVLTLFRQQNAGFSHRKLATAAAVVIGLFTLGLASFGVYFHRIALEGAARLSECVWWIPFL